jgi:hypothetical protein
MAKSGKPPVRVSNSRHPVSAPMGGHSVKIASAGKALTNPRPTAVTTLKSSQTAIRKLPLDRIFGPLEVYFLGPARYSIPI